ncbi:tail fiber tail fiber assembly protein [Yersinia phage vB_YenS_P400]|nr:tail fiber tail fiber assembly protein [Yersinia phage vB_YenS_P400]
MKLNQLDEKGFFIVDHVEGELPENWTADLVGNGYYKAQYQGAVKNDVTGEFTGGVWIETGVAPPVDFLTPAIAERDRLMSVATMAIAPLQDASDLDDISIEEVALLKKWKQYRVSLNRLDLSIAPNIDWPVTPE